MRRLIGRLMALWRRCFPPVAAYQRGGDRFRSRAGALFSVSFSQEAEDLVADQLLGLPAQGCYVDVGAHDPIRFSNTYLFYRRGWRGLNIEPTPDAIRRFEQQRPGDTNYNVGVSDQSGSLEFYEMSDAALNTFDAERVRQLEAETPYRRVRTVQVPMRPLVELLDEYFAQTNGQANDNEQCAGREIDILTIDVEQHELPVLRSSDWERYRPKLVLVEILHSDPENLGQDPVHQFMKSVDYRCVAMTGRTAFYGDAREPSEGAA